MRSLGFAALVITGALVGPFTDLSPASAAEPTLEIRIDRHARITGSGLAFRIHVVCGPLPGSVDFREGFAGASQARIGAAGEGGFSPDASCDGTEREYTADVSVHTGQFQPGPADVSAAVVACNNDGDTQVCVNGAAHRRVTIQGPPR